MQRCGHCNAQQLEGTIFCSECGASLGVAAARRETTASLNQFRDGTEGDTLQIAASHTVIPAPDPRALGFMINLVVLNSGRRLTLDASEELLIGRKDNAKGIYPDVDLGLDGGYDAGVSRRHAIIAINNNTCMLEDLESANGTYINGQRVSARQPTPIRNGDELKFGTLILRVEL